MEQATSKHDEYQTAAASWCGLSYYGFVNDRFLGDIGKI